MSIKQRVFGSILIAGTMLGLLTACADVEVNVKIDDASSVEYSFKATASREDIEASGTMTSDQALEYLKATEDVPTSMGVTYEVVDDGKNIGNITSVKGTYEGTEAKPATLPEVLPTTGAEYLEVVKDESGIITATVPVSEMIASYEIETKEDFQSAFNSFNVVMEFPGNVTEVSNDGKVDGNTVTWTAEQVYSATSTGQSLIAKGEEVPSANTNSMLFIALGLILLLALVGGGFVGFKKLQRMKFEKDRDAIEAEDEEYYRTHPQDRPQDEYGQGNNYSQNQGQYNQQQQNNYGQQQNNQQQGQDQYTQQNQYAQHQSPRDQYSQQQQNPSTQGNNYNESGQPASLNNGGLQQAEGQEIYSSGYLDGYEKGLYDAGNNKQADMRHEAPQANLRPQQSYPSTPSYESPIAPQSQPVAYEPTLTPPPARPRRTLPPLPQMPPRNN